MIRVFVFVRYLFTCNYRSSHANNDSSYKNFGEKLLTVAAHENPPHQSMKHKEEVSQSKRLPR